MDSSEESPSAVEEPTTPEDSEGGTSRTGAAGGWRVVASSVAGRSHLLRDEGNEDAVATSTLEDGTLLLALADGAGSARCAAEGSRIIVAAALEALEALVARGGSAASKTGQLGTLQLGTLQLETRRLETLQGAGQDERGDSAPAAQSPTPGVAPPAALQAALPAALRGALLRARAAVGRRARSERLRPRDFASTLLLAVISGDRLAALQVGDGAVVVRDGHGWRRLTRPLRGEHAGETVFVTSRGAARTAEVEAADLGDITALALLSDGLEPIATDLSSGVPHAPFFAPLADFAAADRPVADKEADLAGFLGSERVQERSSDDLSLVLAVRP